MNNLLKNNKEIMKDWDYNKNDKVLLDSLTTGSNIKVWWKCNKDHSYFASVYHRCKRGQACPYCVNKKVLVGYNDLATSNPVLSKEWNYTKNGDLRPTDVTAGSSRTVWWKCEKGHEWEAVINSRNNGRSCPYCSNKKLLKGFNDLATVNPRVAREWNYQKNGNLKPEDVVAGCQTTVWWICEKGHEWKTKVDKRNKGNNCSICGSERKTSVSEKSILFYIKKYYSGEVISNYRNEIIKNRELDIYIKSLKIGIEYDGRYYHKNKKRDNEKDIICQKKGIAVYHIIESDDKNVIDNNKIIYNINSNGRKNLEWAILNLLKKLFNGDNYDINLDRDQVDIYNLIDFYEKENSLAEKYPELAKEWNYEKNGMLKPNQVSYGSFKKVWWTGTCGHEWKSEISSRTTNDAGCPYCSNNKVLTGFNDLETKNPKLAKEWNYEKNGNITPKDVSPNSNKRVWWKCQKNHEWEAKIQNRNFGGKCPYCSNIKALKGFNDLTTTDSILSNYWDYQKNGTLKPEGYLRGSNKKIFWKCPKCNNEWHARIVDMVSRKKLCKYCKK